jgi:hypothetical protein
MLGHWEGVRLASRKQGPPVITLVWEEGYVRGTTQNYIVVEIGDSFYIIKMLWMFKKMFHPTYEKAVNTLSCKGLGSRFVFGKY